VTVELWLWLGKDLGGDFESPSAMSSVLEADVEEDSTVHDLFGALAARYQAIESKVFVRGTFSPNVVVMVNDKVIGLAEANSTKLVHGDKVTVLPAYAGG
jgi:molybdopterin converting factor small subunit